MKTQDDQFFDLSALSAYSSLPVPMLRDYLNQDGLPHFKLRGEIIVRKTEFDKWLRQHRVDAGHVDKTTSELIYEIL
jgi:hypothetical protein